jgi:predicted nucleotidyltransferase
MATTLLPPDFEDFLRLLNSKGVEYLLIGGYAVGYHGYPRATAGLDVWIATTRANATRVAQALREFGFDLPQLTPDLFLEKDKVIRMGLPPLRIEILTTISGVMFTECYRRREVVDLGGVLVSIISLSDLKANKRAAARHQDLSDLEHLP